MIRLLAIDPGTKDNLGWAIFQDGVFTSSGHGDLRVIRGFLWINFVVIENPQIYPRSKARPSDILKLARIVGRIEEMYSYTAVKLVTPREWKGTINGDVMTRRIKSQFTPREKGMIQNPTHDEVDAIGLGKWALRYFPSGW